MTTGRINQIRPLKSASDPCGRRFRSPSTSPLARGGDPAVCYSLSPPVTVVTPSSGVRGDVDSTDDTQNRPPASLPEVVGGKAPDAVRSGPTAGLP